MTINFPAQIWAQERTIVTVSGFTSGAAYVQVICNTAPMNGLTANYVIPLAGSLKIDISDLVRVIASGSVTFAELADDMSMIGSTTTKSWTRTGLINPESVIIPENEIGEQLDQNIFAPSVMLQPIGAGAPIIFETNQKAGSMLAGLVMELPSETIQNLGSAIQLRTDTTAVEFGFRGLPGEPFDAIGKTELKELEECRKYAAVEWVSFSGATRRHTFEVINCTTETINAVSLQNLENFYDERKGRKDGFAIRLQELNKYDMWYYGDVIMSSNVRISLDGTSWRKVQIVTKKIEIPNTDEGELNTLEIDVNYAKYDTL